VDVVRLEFAPVPGPATLVVDSRAVLRVVGAAPTVLEHGSVRRGSPGRSLFLLPAAPGPRAVELHIANESGSVLVAAHLVAGRPETMEPSYAGARAADDLAAFFAALRRAAAGDIDGAREASDAVHAPKFAAAHALAARLILRDGAEPPGIAGAAARAHYRETLEVDPKAARSALELAEAEWSDGRLREAVTHAERAAAVAPEWAAAATPARPRVARRGSQRRGGSSLGRSPATGG